MLTSQSARGVVRAQKATKRGIIHIFHSVPEGKRQELIDALTDRACSSPSLVGKGGGGKLVAPLLWLQLPFPRIRLAPLEQVVPLVWPQLVHHLWVASLA